LTITWRFAKTFEEEKNSILICA